MKNKFKLFICLILITIPFFVSCNAFSTSYSYDNAEVIEVNTSVSEVVSKVEKACVGIQRTAISNSSASVGLGSGVIFKQEGLTYYVITNYHVVSDSNNNAQDANSNINYKVFLGSSNYGVSATYVCGNYQKDLAVLKFNCTNADLVKVIDLSKSNEILLSPGETCISIGCPLDLVYYNTVSVGNVSKDSYTISNNGGSLEIVQHNCGINPGNSGGALFNLNGDLIGINFKKTNSITEGGQVVYVEGLNYAISLSEVLSFLSNNKLI